ncbi:hypothetical protein HK097_002545, partial [Rhizophlyctis rosea]
MSDYLRARRISTLSQPSHPIATPKTERCPKLLPWKTGVRSYTAEPALLEPEAQPYPSPAKLSWSSEQTHIFEEVANGTAKVLVVDAKAGSGKTTTLIESIAHIPRRPGQRETSVLLLAYNRSNADLLHLRVDRLKTTKNISYLRGTSTTFHSLGNSLLCKALGTKHHKVHIEDHKTRMILQVSDISPENFCDLSFYIEKLTAKAKLHGLVPKADGLDFRGGLMEDTYDKWQELINLYQIIPVHKREEYKEEEIIKWARYCLRESFVWAGLLFKNGSSYVMPEANVHQDVRALNTSRELGAARSALMGKFPRNRKGTYAQEVESTVVALKSGDFLLDFDEMLYFPIVCNLPVPKYDVIMVDEAQDMSEVRTAFVLRMAELQNSRVILYGDANQNIFQFAGCTSDFFDKLHKRASSSTTTSMETSDESLNFFPPNTTLKTLPLSVSYRCPKSVIQIARRIVPGIKPAANAIEGEIHSLGRDFNFTDLHDKDTMVVGRLTTELVNLAIYLWSIGIPCELAGRMVGKDLLELLRWSGVHNEQSISDLGEALMKKRAMVTRESLRASGGPLAIGEIEGLDDRIDTLMEIAKRQLWPGAKVWELRLIVEDLRDEVRRYRASLNYPTSSPPPIPDAPAEIHPSDPDEVPESRDQYFQLVLCTMHKARGLERDDVYILNDTSTMWNLTGHELFKSCSTNHIDSDMHWSDHAERNLRYIAATRAKRCLSFVDWDPKGRDGEFLNVERVNGKEERRRAWKKGWREGTFDGWAKDPRIREVGKQE